MKATQVIPVLRIFDYDKAIAFYVQWLGFAVQWEHQFEPDMPRYIAISKGEIVFHLSEHHGDGTPGTHVFIWCEGVKEWCAELKQKDYKYYRPSVAETFYGTWCMKVIDPFNNQISFNQKIEQADN